MEGYLKLKRDDWNMPIAIDEAEWKLFKLNKATGEGYIECQRILKNGDQTEMIIAINEIEWIQVKNQKEE